MEATGGWICPRGVRHVVMVLLLTLPGLGSVFAATLDGVVVDGEGTGVADATVWVTQHREVRTLKTDGAGRFSTEGIDVAMTEVVAFKEGLSLGGATALIVGDASLEVQLRPADSINLKLLQIDSKPLPGVSVQSMLVEGRFLVSVEDLVSAGLPPIRSNDQGILVIPNLPVGGYVQLVLAHANYADSSVTYLPVEQEQRNIVLQQGQRVGGRVTFDEKGVADVRVSVFKSGAQGQKEFAEVLTDTDGFFNARVHPDRYAIAVEHKAYASPAPIPVEVAPNEEVAPVGIELEAPHYIHGTVEFPDKSPCGGTRVLYRIENTVYQDTFTNNDGAFSLRVPGAPGRIAILPPRGYRTPNFGDIEVDLGAVKETTLKPIRLDALPVIVGDIRDVDGENPGHVLITAMNLPTPYSAMTDEKGHFSLPLDFMPDVDTLVLRAEHSRRFQRAEIKVPLKKVKPFDVKLEAFSPDLDVRKAITGANNLDGLIGKPAPELRGTEWLNSKPQPLSDLKGKVVVLFFWVGFDEGVGPVALALQELMTLHQLLADVEDVAIISVHDAVSSADEIRAFIKRDGITFPVLRGDDEQATFSSYGIVFVPQIVLLDKKGNVRYYQTEDRLLSCIKGLRRE